MKVPPVVHFLGKNAIRLVLLLIFVGLPATAWYLREVGIGFGAREALARALSNEVVNVEIRRLSFDPFSGLIAEGVNVQEAKPDGRALAKLSEVSVSLNLSQLMAGRIFVDRLVLSNASVSIPLSAKPDARRVEIENVRAELSLLGERLRLSRFDGTVEGIRLVLSGQFLNPRSLKMPQAQPSARSDQREDLLVRLLDEVAEIRGRDGQLVLRANIDADLARPESVRISDLSLSAGELAGRGWKLRDVEMNGEFADGILRVPRLIIRDEGGAMEVSAEWNSQTGALDAALLSTLHLAPFFALLEERVPVFKDLRLDRAPQIEARVVGGTRADAAPMRVTGSAVFPDVIFKGVPFEDVALNFAWRDGIFYGRDVRVSAARGRLNAKLWIAPNDFRIEAKNSIPPTKLLGIFDPKTREFIANMEFKDLPEMSVSLRGTKLDFADIRAKGHIKLGRTAIRESWLDSGEADFELADRCVTYRNLVIRRGDGRGTGTFAYDVGRQEARLSDIKSTMMPRDVLMWIDPKIAEALVPYRFRGPPATVVQGMVHLKDATKNNLSIAVESSGLEYDLLSKTLKLGKTSAQVNVVGTKVRADVKRSTLMGGDLALKAIVSIDEKDPSFSVDLQLKRVNFAQLTKLYFKYDDSKGVLSGNYKFDAFGGRENLMKGSGSIRVEDGNVFAIPVLGPFSEILGTLLPGIGYQTARLASADFTVANEIINSKNLVIEGARFSMIGAGDIHFMTSQLDMSMRVNAKGIPGLVFYPVSKLFEYISTGTVAEPEWRPKIIPRIDNDSPPVPRKPPASR